MFIDNDCAKYEVKPKYRAMEFASKFIERVFKVSRLAMRFVSIHPALFFKAGF